MAQSGRKFYSVKVSIERGSVPLTEGGLQYQKRDSRRRPRRSPRPSLTGCFADRAGATRFDVNRGMDLQVGSLVEHNSWGRGKILALRQPNAEAYFPSLATETQGPTRMVRLTSLSLSSVQTDPVLDQVEGRKPGSKAGAKVKTAPKRPENNLDQAIEWFSREYPAHFADERFIKGEVALKRAAQQLFADKLGNGAGEALLAAGNFAEIGTLLDAVYRTTKIPSRLELAALHKGLKESAAAAHLLEGLLALLATPNAQIVRAAGRRRRRVALAQQGPARPDLADRHDPSVPGRPHALHRQQAGDRQAGRRPFGQATWSTPPR